MSALAVALVAAGASSAQAALHFDFETGDLQGWAVVDGAFGKLVCDRAMSRNTPGMAYPKQGLWYFTTTELEDGGFDDGMTGVVESPVFALRGERITLQVGGGSHPDTFVALCSEDGDYVRVTHGANSEVMQPVEWDVPELVGKKLYLQVVDRNTGGWGHVTLDDVRIDGVIDEEATARVRAGFAEREAARIERERIREAERQAGRELRRQDMLESPDLVARGETTVYSGEHLGAISLPVGGIGTGTVNMNGSAERHVWQIFNNMTQATLPHSFFAVCARAEGRPAVVRALQTVAVGAFPPVASLSFRGEYPFGWYDFEDPDLPVRAHIRVFNPLVPLSVADSSIPCAIYELTAANDGPSPVSVCFLATQQNAVGYTGVGEVQGCEHEGYGLNRNDVLVGPEATVLRMTSGKPADSPGFGDMALAAIGPQVSASASWTDDADLLSDVATDARLDGPSEAGPSAAGATVDGALASSFDLGPGESRTVTFVLAWRFPNAAHGAGGWGGPGNAYCLRWPSALAVARDIVSRLGELTKATELYHDTLYESNLPHWLLDRLSSQVAILRSATCFWTAGGYFGGWEGCGGSAGCCQGNCSHVWHYAQAHARLFPEVGRLTREQEFDHQLPDGGVPHRQLSGVGPAFDGQCGSILGAYREHLVSTDGRWLAEVWPKVKRAMDYIIATWDADEDGVLAGAQWNTLDAELDGSSSWMGSLYLASLAASERMALLQSDPDSATRYARIREAGSRRQDETLFNGDYYVQLPGARRLRDYFSGCHIDQVLGQWWASQLGLGWVYPREHVATAMRALLRGNFRPDFRGIPQAPRKFVADEDAGMQMITWPRGGRPDPDHCMLYADEAMTGFEYAAAATMVQCGLLREGLLVAKAVHDRYDGRLRIGLTPGDTSSWGYSGNPFGDDECGKYYARAMSVWSLLLAAQGFTYDGPAGSIGFAPVWRPDEHVSFFTAAEGWGLFRQTRRDGDQMNVIEVRYGKLAIESLRLVPPEGMSRATVRVGEQAIEPTVLPRDDGAVMLQLPARITLAAGQSMTILLTH